MNEAHHGFPGATLAAARYWSTCGPRVRPDLAHAALALSDAQRRGTDRAPAAATRTAAAASATATAPGAAGTCAATRPAGCAAGPGPRRAWSGSDRGTARRGARRRRSTRRRVRVVDRLAGRDPRLLDGLGVVEEPLDLQLGLVGVAGVLALVPDPDAHLEEADGVGVAEVEVLHPRLDERGHQRQLRRRPALLGLARHPRGDLLARGVVAGVGVGSRGGRAGDRGGVGHGRAGARGHAAALAFGGSTAFRNAIESFPARACGRPRRPWR